MGYLDFLFLGYAGRIGRTAYWIGYIVLSVIQVLAILVLLQLAHGTLEQFAQYANAKADLPDEVAHALLTHVVLPIGIVAILFQWPQYAIAAKRWHDRGKSGWWSLIAFVPVIGGFWALIELGFLPGEEGENDYGYR